MFGPWQMSAWAAQFVLESIGAWNTRRQRGILFSYLRFSAIADLIDFTILMLFGKNAYGCAAWAVEAVQYVFLCALACQLAAKWMDEWRPIWRQRMFLGAAGATIITVIVRNEPRLIDKFLSAELAASCYLCILLIVGWIGKKKGLEEPWRLITAGLIFSAAGNAIFSIAATRITWAFALYPIPAIGALLVWNLSVLPRKPKSILLEEARLPLGKTAKLPVEILEGIQ